MLVGEQQIAGLNADAMAGKVRQLGGGTNMKKRCSGRYLPAEETFWGPVKKKFWAETRSGPKIVGSSAKNH
jgi:hypothetical protein